MEKLGVICGVLGAFIAAAGFGLFGYPLFTLSSVLLFISAKQQKNINLMYLQSAFLMANIVGIKTFVFGV